MPNCANVQITCYCITQWCSNLSWPSNLTFLGNQFLHCFFISSNACFIRFDSFTFSMIWVVQSQWAFDHGWSCVVKNNTPTHQAQHVVQLCEAFIEMLFFHNFKVVLDSGPTALMFHLKIVWFPTLKGVIIHDMQGYPLSPRRYGGIPSWKPILKSCTPWYCVFLYNWKRHKIWELFVLSTISTYKGQWTFLCGHCYLCNHIVTSYFMAIIIFSEKPSWLCNYDVSIVYCSMNI